MALRLFRNYTKRNSVQPYLQSHAAIGLKLINTLIYKKFDKRPSSTSADELLFWIYTTLREDILPINYFNQYL
jgi:hypothetical protein